MLVNKKRVDLQAINIPALFLLLPNREKRAGFPNPVNNPVLESYSNRDCSLEESKIRITAL